MKYRTSNNSLTNIKDNSCSVKRINNLSNRIRNLENDIEKIKNSKKKNTYSNHNIELEKNYSMIVNDSSIKKNLKDAFKINKAIVKNPYFFRVNKKHIKYRTQNNSLKKNKSSKDRINIYKRIQSKNYTQIIHDKKNKLISAGSNMNKNEKDIRQRLIQDSNYNNDIKYFHKNSYLTKGNSSDNTSNNNINEIQFHIKKNNRLQHYLSADKISTNSNLNIKNKKEEKNTDENYDILDLEFEIRNLKKRKKFLMKLRNETEEKLLFIKDKNMKLKESIIKQENYKENIINKLMILNKEYLSYKNQTESDEVEDDSDYSNKNIIKKDIIFNIMDMKIEYEKNILLDEFIEGLNQLLGNISLLNNFNNSDNNIANKINRLLHLKNKLEYFEEKYTTNKLDNDKYYIYLSSLLNKLNLNSFDELKEYIINIFIKNIKENKRMKEITSALINENILPEKNEKHKPKIKYNNKNTLNRNEKKGNYDYNNYKYKTSNKNNNNLFRNKRNNSSHFHGMCYNSFLEPNNKRNIFNNKINKKNTEYGIFINNNEFNNKYQRYYNENDIYFLRGEEEKN